MSENLRTKPCSRCGEQEENCTCDDDDDLETEVEEEEDIQIVKIRLKRMKGETEKPTKEEDVMAFL